MRHIINQNLVAVAAVAGAATLLALGVEDGWGWLLLLAFAAYGLRDK